MCLVVVASALFLAPSRARTQDRDPGEGPGKPAPRGQEAKEAAAADPISTDHPLASVMQYARDEQAYLARTVRDFTCVLVKRERIEGELQDYNFIEMRVREQVRDGDRVTSPLALFLHFMAPKPIAGRTVIYVEGQNDNKMLVRNGGKHFDYVVVHVDPYGEGAQRESLVAVPKSGFDHILTQMIDVLKRHAQADPTGENTKVDRISGAKVNKRPCSVIRITHPEKQPGLEFHVANVFVDSQLHLPVRVDLSSWPTAPNKPPELLAEYTYTELKVNVNLNDRTFDPAQLKADR
jgi:Protein of unknown function (DUF1571)